MCRLALVITAALPLLAAGATAQGQTRDVAIEPAHRRFAEQYVAAAGARDAERYRKLIHPKSLGCITPDNRDYFDDWIARAFAVEVGGPVPDRLASGSPGVPRPSLEDYVTVTGPRGGAIAAGGC
jgi:hypothetical protein